MCRPQPETAMGELHLAELGHNFVLLGIVVDVSDINSLAACDLTTLVNLARAWECKGDESGWL